MKLKVITLQQKKLLAIVYALEIFLSYLIGLKLLFLLILLQLNIY